MSGFLFVQICYNNKSMTKIVKVLLLSLVVIPIIVSNSFFSPFVIGKSLFLGGVISLVSILFLINFFSNKKWKVDVLNKLNIYYKHPIIVAIFAFIFTFSISTLFAIDKYHAFWGDIERAEGLTAMVCFLSFFIFTLLVFEKKEWLWFFRLSLFTTLILVVKEFSQLLGGVGRPGSFLGNPIFLAGYLLFSIFCSIFVFSEDKIKFWKYFSVITFILSILGIFITQTRGTILGLIVGFTFVLIYGIIKGKNVFYKKFNLRKFAIILLCLTFIFSVLFVVTRKNEIWQKVPGVSRVALISGEDSSTQARLLMIKVSMNAINPSQNGWKKFIIGWGPENFRLAYGKYFDSRQFNYEDTFFDRAHNKLLDVLVMNGILGLFSYLSIFLIFLFFIFKRKEFSLINLGLLFWLVAYFIHLLFIFDQITTWIPFFALLSYVVYSHYKDVILIKKNDNNPKRHIFIGISFLILSAFSVYVFYSNTLPGYIQMYKFKILLEKGDINIILNKINSTLSPFTLAQSDIRSGFLTFLQNNYDINSVNINKLVNIDFEKEEEYLKKVPFDFKNKTLLARTYTNIGKASNNIEFLKKGEVHFNELISFSPNRPDYKYSLALNLLFQKRFDEAFIYFEESFNLSPGLFAQNKSEKIEDVYINLLKYFYQTKNLDSFIKTANRLSINNYSDGASLTKIIDYIEKNKTWPKIDFGI